LSQVFSNVQRQSENSSSFNYALVKKDGELYFIGQKLDSLYIFKLNMEYAALQEGQPIFMTPQNVRKFMSAMNLTKEDIVSLVDQAVVCAIEPGVELQQFVDAVIVTPDQDAVSFLTDNRVEMLPIVAVSDASQFVENIMSMSLENDAEQGIENSIKLELLTDHLDAMKQQIENLGPNPTSVDEGVSEIVEPYIRNLYPLLDNVEKIATAAAQDIKDVISDLPDNKKLLSEQEVKKSLTVCKNFYESIKPYLNAASESIKNFFLAVGRIIVRIIKALGEVLSYLGRTAKPVDAVFDSLPKTPEMAKAKKMTKTASHLATQAGNLLNGASKWMGNALKEEKKGDEPTSSAQELKQQEEPKKTEGRIIGRKRPRDFP